MRKKYLWMRKIMRNDGMRGGKLPEPANQTRKTTGSTFMASPLGRHINERRTGM